MHLRKHASLLCPISRLGQHRDCLSGSISQGLESDHYRTSRHELTTIDPKREMDHSVAWWCNKMEMSTNRRVTQLRDSNADYGKLSLFYCRFIYLLIVDTEAEWTMKDWLHFALDRDRGPERWAARKLPDCRASDYSSQDQLQRL